MSWLDVRPLSGLLSPRRGWLVASSALVLAYGLGWLALLPRLFGASPLDDAASVAALVVSAAIALPAAVGICVGEVLHEVLRRPLTALLPDLRRRLRRASLVLAFGVALTAAGGLAPLREDLSLATAFALALAGFACGTWVFVRLGGTLGWILPLGSVMSLLALADPLAAWLTRTPLAALLVALAAVGVLSLRFHSRLARALLFSPIGSLFVAGKSSRSPSAPRRDVEPPAKLGGSLRGWLAAVRFEQASSWALATLTGAAGFAAVTLALALIGPLFAGLLEVDGGIFERLRGLPLVFADALVGLPEGAAEGAAWPQTSHSPTLVTVIGFAFGVQAWVCSVPLLGGFLYPIGRVQRGRLAFHASVRSFARIALGVLALGLALGSFLLWIEGVAWPARLPNIAWVVLACLLLAAWAQATLLGLLHLFGRSHPLLLISGAGGLLVFVAFRLADLQVAWHELVGGRSPVTLAGTYVAALFASYFLLRQVHAWYWRRADLCAR